MALAPDSRLGPGGAGAGRRGRDADVVGERDDHDDAQGAAGAAVPRAVGLGERAGEAPTGPGLARPVDLQSPVRGRRGVRVGALAGLPQGAARPALPRWDRSQRPDPVKVFSSIPSFVTIAYR